MPTALRTRRRVTRYSSASRTDRFSRWRCRPARSWERSISLSLPATTSSGTAVTRVVTLNFPVAAGYHFEWNGGHTRLYASQRAFDGGRVFEIEPNGFTLLRTFETGGSAQAIQLSADGSKLFVAAQNGGVIVWDVASNSLATTYATPNCSPYGLVRTPDFLVVGCLNGLVEVLDPNSGALVESLNVGGEVRELSYDPGTRSILAPNNAGWVDILR